MTTQGAVSHTKKALCFMEELADRNNTLYTSTRDSIQEMINNCLNIIEIGQNLLGNPCRTSRSVDSTATDLTYGNQVSREEFNMLLQAVRQTAENVNVLSSGVAEMVVQLSSNDSDIHECTEIDSKLEVTDNGHLETKSCSSMKSEKVRENQLTVKCVGDAVATVDLNLKKDNSISSEIVALGSAISDWFRCRIQNLDKKASRFRYHAENLIDYIRAIVLDFSLADDSRSWFESFDSWITRLKCNDLSVSSYALPYDTFQTFKHTKQKSCIDMKDNVKFNVLWNILIDNGLYRCIRGASKIFDPQIYSDDLGNELRPEDVWEYITGGVVTA